MSTTPRRRIGYGHQALRCVQPTLGFRILHQDRPIQSPSDP